MHRGDHACVIYSGVPELIAVVATFLYEGLQAGERCWYAGAASDISHLRVALQVRGIAVTAAEGGGSLRLTTSVETYLADGTFNPERVLQQLNFAIAAAVHDGFAGLRIAGEMSWALQPKPGTDRVIEYESAAEQLLRASDALALCLYHRHLMPAALIDGALASHSLASVGSEPRPNAFYRAKPIADLRTPNGHDIPWKLKHLQREEH
jgi:MEDS: MEthanogen/methylotroph, DcmR Sensory domain